MAEEILRKNRFRPNFHTEYYGFPDKIYLDQLREIERIKDLIGMMGKEERKKFEQKYDEIVSKKIKEYYGAFENMSTKNWIDFYNFILNEINLKKEE